MTDLSYLFLDGEPGGADYYYVPAVAPKKSNKEYYTNDDYYDSSAVVFPGTTSFNEDISSWNTSAVQDMSGMFYGAESFDVDISIWQTARVRDMSFMFVGAAAFNRDLSNWRVAAVTDLSNMFGSALTSGVTASSGFNQDLCAWGQQLGRSTFVNGMFSRAFLCPEAGVSPNLFTTIPGPFCYSCAKSFETTTELRAAVEAYVQDDGPQTQVAQTYGYPIGSWRVGNISDFSFLFESLSFNDDISDWDVSKVSWDLFGATVSSLVMCPGFSHEFPLLK